MDETTDDVKNKLEQWKDALESKSFQLSWSKNEYSKCCLSKQEGGIEDEVTIGGYRYIKGRKIQISRLNHSRRTGLLSNE